MTVIRKDLTGQTCGLVTVISPAEPPEGESRRSHWYHTRCSCGTARVMHADQLEYQAPTTHIACKRAKARARGLWP